MKEIQHIPWPEIRQFHQVRRDVQYKAQFKGFDENGEPIMDRLAHMPVLSYEGTVKLHGCNTAVQIHKNGTVVCQSRERIITTDDDCYGFARFVVNLPSDIWETHMGIKQQLSESDNDIITIFGEWVGPGIQKGVAISQIPKKSWFIFGAKTGTDDESAWVDISKWSYCPSENIYNIHNFPTFNIQIDFENPGEMINQMNDLTLQVEECCPVGNALGVKGIGEGIVWSCVTPGYQSSKFRYKTKGQKHSQSKVTKLATVDVEKLNTIKEFVSLVLDESRLEQGISKLLENNKPVVEQSTGDFLRWIVNDIIKENKEQMQQCGIEEKEIGKIVNVEARRWYLNKCKEI